ncbi:MAG: peptidoglycan-binding protein LysM, partial [Oceanicaulis sp.]
MAATRSFVIAAFLLVAAVMAAALFIVMRPGAEPAPVEPSAETAAEPAPASAERAALSPPSFDVVRV